MDELKLDLAPLDTGNPAALRLFLLDMVDQLQSKLRIIQQELDRLNAANKGVQP